MVGGVWGPARLHGATALYTNEADFVAAFGAQPFVLNEFTNLDYYGQLVHSLKTSANGISYALVSSPPIHLVAFPGAVSTVNTNDQIIANFTSGNVTGVGGRFFSADSNGVVTNGTVTVTLSDGTWTNLTTSTGDPAPFVGFISDGPIYTSMTVTNSAGSGCPGLAHYYVADGIPVPVISLNASGKLVVAWGASPSGFALQATGSLSPSAWTNVVQEPTPVGDQLQVTLPAGARGAFFRLMK